MNILIVGKYSYIGNHIDEWLKNAGHMVTQLDVLNEDWKIFNFRPYDVIVHVAAIVHRPNCKDWDLFKTVNIDLALSIASLAKKQGVTQFIFFSTMGVYGKGKKLISNIIDENCSLLPEGFYGKSKQLAEEGLNKLADRNFKVSIMRPPSVYGKGCRGHYISGFTKIVSLLPIVPKAYGDVRQSFLYIDNLCECVRLVIEDQLQGVFCPQDDEIPNTNELLKSISEGIGKKYRESKLLGCLMRCFNFIPIVNKVYGGIEYSRSISDIKGKNYIVVPFKEAIQRTVAK